MNTDAPHERESEAVDQRLAINASWLVRLRWAAAVGQLVTVLAVQYALGVDLPMFALLLVIAVTIFSNCWLSVWFRRINAGDSGRHRSAWHRILGGIMLLDLISLTTLLLLTGGPANPFSVFYFVNLGLAAILLPPRWAWLLNGFVVLCLAVLFYDHAPIDQLQRPERLQGIRTAGRITSGHVGLFVAFVTCASVIIYSTTRLTGELRQRELDLRRAEASRARSERLEALGTMAAGAAHELATPLSTIAIVTKEVQRELTGRHVSAELIGDIQVIRDEVDRCRTILDRMSADAGQPIGEGLSSVTVGHLFDTVLERLADRHAVRVSFDEATAATRLRVPVQVLAQAVRGVVQNALDASPGQTSVQLGAESAGANVVLSVRDAGRGMSAEVLERAGEPFFTTKEPGKGMGLGLFLARSVVERLGGSLSIESKSGRGTIVSIRLPVMGGE